MYQDKTLTCRECGQEFTFTASEQAFYAEKGFQNEPGRCPACRPAVRTAAAAAPSARCTKSSATAAAAPRRFPSSPVAIGLSIAANASPRIVRSIKLRPVSAA